MTVNLNFELRIFEYSGTHLYPQEPAAQKNLFNQLRQNHETHAMSFQHSVSSSVIQIQKEKKGAFDGERPFGRRWYKLYWHV